jgi:hypothetical protein
MAHFFRGLFNNFQYPNYTASDCRMKNKLERILKKAVIANTRCFPKSVEQSMENNEKLQLQ